MQWLLPTVLLTLLFENIVHIGCMVVGHANQALQYDAHYLTKRMDLETCLAHFDIHKNTIIRTGESQAIGGKYIQGIELDTIEECQRLCCETESCDVYIFETKHEGYCYLFECGPPENFHCKFTRHGNYTSALLTPASHVAEITTPRPTVPHISTTNISQQELELTNLKMKSDTRQTESNQNANALANNAGVGQPQVQTLDANRIQRANHSTHCGRFQFTCHSGECIAVYNACDGIPQCEDGSDEGPECNSISSATAVAQQKSVLESNVNKVAPPMPQQQPPAPQFQSVLMQQYTPEQQLQNIQLQQTQQSNGMLTQPLLNNREDPDVWMNRKIVATNQQTDGLSTAADLNNRIFNHKGGLHVAGANSGYVSNNVNLNPLYDATLQRSGIYLPPQQPQIEQTGLYAAQPAAGMDQSAMMQQQGHVLLNNNMNWQTQQAAQQQQQQHLAAYMPQQQQQQQLLLPAAPPEQLQAQQIATTGQNPVMPAQPQQAMQTPAIRPAAVLVNKPLPAIPTANVQNHQQLNANSYEDDYEDESTEPPKKKQRKHKKVKTTKQNVQPAIPAATLTLTTATPTTTTSSLAAQKSNAEKASSSALSMYSAALAPAASPVHEQIKMIHDNLALEFHDHDGLSERPSGALLSLTLGVLVTAALAILIGCRMRTVGRRARRLGGKTPYSHEADFLVNGMYL